MDFDALQRSFFDSLYTYRIEIAIGSVLAGALLLLLAWRLGWLASARRHPARAGLLLVVALAIGLPVGYYTASPLWIRTELIEPDPVAVTVPSLRPTTAPTAPIAPTAPTAQATDAAAPAPSATTAAPEPTPFAPRRLAEGAFRGTDDFHFGRGTALIVETAPGSYVLRLEDFSVRNGPDLFVYLSPVADDFADGALELGRLKATDGSFSYALPPGTDPSDFASAIIWCKQFAHLFAVAPLADV